MQKTILKIVAITACAGAMMACAKLIWNVTYDRTDRVGIFANLVHEGPQSSILMAGWAVTEYPQGEYVFFPYGNALVASYDDHGKLQWSRELGNSDSTLGAFAVAHHALVIR
jgi:hypothetical protein